MATRSTKSRQQVETQSKRQPYLLENDAQWGGFINIRLSEKQTDEFRVWHEGNGQYVPGYIDEILGAGCKVSLSYDAQNECFVCALTGALVDATPSSRFCSTSRAESLQAVLALTVWKHVYLVKGDYGNYQPSTGNFLRFG